MGYPRGSGIQGDRIFQRVGYTLQKGHGKRDLEGTWHQRYPTLSHGQTNTCENITFLQLRWPAVKTIGSFSQAFRSDRLSHTPADYYAKKQSY